VNPTVLHLTEDHSQKNFGVTTVVDALIHQDLLGINQAVVSIGPDAIDVPANVPLHILKSKGLAQIWRMGSGQSGTLHRLIDQANVIHLHGVWMWLQWAGACYATSIGTPAILSSHGMLEPWHWQNKTWPHRLKKILYWRLFASPAFRRLPIIHAITHQEAHTLRRYFPAQRIEVIPNGIDLPAIDRTLSSLPPGSQSRKPYILFLSRLHPIKGIHLLINAFADLDQDKYRLVIAGPLDDRPGTYTTELRRLADQRGVSNQVEFPGIVQGAAKWQLYRDAWVFCLPSYSEGLAMVNLEAAATGTPVITTPASGLVDSWATEGGLFSQPTVENLRACLARAIAWSAVERQQHGLSLRSLVERTYTWSIITPSWHKLYLELSKH
jgi:glycosyltransferase involved in cell wall biosynthesis